MGKKWRNYTVKFVQHLGLDMNIEARCGEMIIKQHIYIGVAKEEM